MFPREILFLEMYTFIYFTLLVFKLWQKQFSQKLQFCEGGTILNLNETVLMGSRWGLRWKQPTLAYNETVCLGTFWKMLVFDAPYVCFPTSLFMNLFSLHWNTLKDLMPITVSSPRVQPEVVHFLISNESPYFSSCKSKISASNSL